MLQVLADKNEFSELVKNISDLYDDGEIDRLVKFLRTYLVRQEQTL
jgi:hypothetical protein